MYTDFETFRAMLRVAHSPANFSVRRALFTDTLLSLSTLASTLNRVAERIDDELYAGYRDQPLGKPVYIVAAPRSGTTFLHRLMSHDPQFTSFKMLETFFPTVTGTKVIDHFMHANGAVGKTIDVLRRKLDESTFGAWSGIHDTGLMQDEEDEGIWALALSTIAVWLVLPFPGKFDHLRFVDQLPEAKRQKLVEYYRSCVQRHLYSNPGKTLLGKNVLLAGRFEIVTAALPEARFVHVLRHPYEALPSMLSLFTVPWRWHSPEIRVDGPETRALTDVTIEYYRFLHQKSQESERDQKARFYNVTYRDLLQDPVARVREIYDRFQLELRPATLATLTEQVNEQRKWKSDHHYSLEQFGLSKDYVYERMPEIFEHYGFAR